MVILLCWLVVGADSVGVFDSLVQFEDWEEARQTYLYGSYQGYYTPQMAFALFDQLQQHYPNLSITQQNLTTTLQNRKIRLYQIGDPSKPAIFFTSMVHARQLFALNHIVMVFLKVVHSWLHHQSNLLDHFKILILPVVNPDGVAYRLDNHPNARKNRNSQAGGCIRNKAGVDINRNFGKGFGLIKGSSIACQQEYRGKGPFSQRESQAVRKVVQNHHITLHVDIHSYGNEFIIPYSHSSLHLEQEFPFLSSFFGQLKKNCPVPIGNSLSLIYYQADGVMMDWMASQNIISLTYEGGHSFKQPKSQLKQDLHIADKAFQYLLSYAEKDSFSHYSYTVKFVADRVVLIVKKYSLYESAVVVEGVDGKYRVEGEGEMKDFKGGEEMVWPMGKILQVEVEKCSSFKLLSKQWSHDFNLTCYENEAIIQLSIIIIVLCATIVFLIYLRFKKPHSLLPEQQTSQPSTHLDVS